MAEIAYIALGSNIGDRALYLRAARRGIAELRDTRVLAESDVEETDPIGPGTQGKYLNQMIAVETGLPPEELLAELHRIEGENGRARGERWGPRTLDLDIVRYGEIAVATPTLTLPHPGLEERDFWQRELAQVEGEAR